MTDDLQRGDHDIIHAATACVAAADVISIQQKQAILHSLARLREEQGCVSDDCPACHDRSGCARRVFDIMGAH